MTTIAYEDADAALCIWECALQDTGVYNWLIGDEGACQGRDETLTLAPFAEHAWKRASGLGYDVAFDWEFIPRFMVAVVARFEDVSGVTMDAASEIGETIYIGDDS